MKPLEGIRVLDLTRVLSGPYCTRLLTDLGATVWKVESPKKGDITRGIEPRRAGVSYYFEALNRKKKSIALNIFDPRGRDIVRKLAEKVDVVVENFRPGVADDAGLGHQVLRELNPELIYCSISGFGQTGPYRNRPAYDVAVQALGGLMSVTGEADGPPVRAGLPIADLATGLMAALGIVSSLHRRSRTGQGDYIDLAMLDTMVSLLTYSASLYEIAGEVPARVGSRHQQVVPYGAYQTADGWIVFATLSDQYWLPLCKLLGLDDLAQDATLERNADRVARRSEVDAAVERATRRQTTSYWESVCVREGIPVSPILSIPELLSHPQVLAREMVGTYDHPNLGEVHGAIASPLKFEGSEDPNLEASPGLGADTATIISQALGWEGEELDGLREADVLDC